MNFFGGIGKRPRIAVPVEGGGADLNGIPVASVNRLAIDIGHGTVKVRRSSIARYIDVVPRYGSRRRIPGESRMGFANNLDRRVRRSNDAEPNREQCTTTEN